MRAGGAVLLAMLLAPAARSAEVPRAVATASRAEVSVGDTFTVTVQVTGPAGAEYTFPPEAADEAFELRSEPPTSNPPPPGTHRYRAAVFAVGEATVPPIPVRYRLPDGATGEIRTAPIPLRIVSLLPKDQEERKLADVRGPVRLGVGRAFWVGVGVAALSIVALAWWLASRRRSQAPAPVAATPAIPPDQDARRALDTLWASGRLSRGEYRLFYIELTAIAKRYLERRLDAPIVEMTTAEMLAHLRSRAEGADLISTMRDLSGAADTIKFARGSALVEEAERHWTAVGALIATLEARLRPAPPEGNRAA